MLSFICVGRWFSPPNKASTQRSVSSGYHPRHRAPSYALYCVCCLTALSLLSRLVARLDKPQKTEVEEKKRRRLRKQNYSLYGQLGHHTHYRVITRSLADSAAPLIHHVPLSICVCCAVLSVSCVEGRPSQHVHIAPLDDNHGELRAGPLRSAHTGHTSTPLHTASHHSLAHALLPSSTTSLVAPLCAERLAREAQLLCQYSKKSVLTGREIMFACRLLLPGDLSKHAMAEGLKAMNKYMASKPRWAIK